jgi:hypothetical protein
MESLKMLDQRIEKLAAKIDEVYGTKMAQEFAAQHDTPHKLSLVPPMEEAEDYNLVLNVAEVSPSVIKEFFDEYKAKIKQIDRYRFTLNTPISDEHFCKVSGRRIRHFFKSRGETVHISYQGGPWNLEPEEVTPVTDEAEQRTDAFIDAHQEDWVCIGTHYRYQRTEGLKLSQREVAKLLGCSSSSISNFESGAPMKTARMIACGYNLLIALYRHGVPLNNMFSSAPDPWDHFDDEVMQ